MEQLRVDRFRIKELQRRKFKVFTNFEKHRHGGQCSPRGDALDIAPVLAQF